MKIQKDKKVVEVTERAYNVVYKGLGYKQIGETEKPKRTAKKGVQGGS